MSAKTALLIGLLLAVARPIAQLERAIINLSMPDARPGQVSIKQLQYCSSGLLD